MDGRWQTIDALNTPNISMIAAVEYIAPSAVEIPASLGKFSIFETT